MVPPSRPGFGRSILIVAHPDDEVLWFGSVLQSVEKIIFCFFDPSRTSKASFRCSLSRYPLSNVEHLELQESGAHNHAEWPTPRTGRYGLELPYEGPTRERYIQNFHAVVTRLEKLVPGYDTIFTHNPWGEYGHEEHVQLYKAVHAAIKGKDTAVWFPCYYSDKSRQLMNRYVPSMVCDSFSLEVNEVLVQDLFNWYQSENSWTWYNDPRFCAVENWLRLSVGGAERATSLDYSCNKTRADAAFRPAGNTAPYRSCSVPLADPALCVEQVDQGFVLSSERTTHPVQVNGTMLAIVERCNGLRTVGEIIHALAAALDIADEFIARDVQQALEVLQHSGLVSFAPVEDGVVPAPPTP